MPMTPFVKRFPELGVRETRSVIAPDKAELPSGKYSFVELYCDEPSCDCRRVVVAVLRPETDWKFWAVINYGWESVKFYKKWARAPAWDRSDWQGPELDPLSEQTPYAPVLLDLFKWLLQSGSAQSAQLTPFSVPPHQTVKLDVTEFLNKAGLKDWRGNFNLVLNANAPRGALLLASGSVDQANNYVFEVFAHDVAESASKGLHYWSTASGDDTMLTVWNPADETQDFIFTLLYTGGTTAIRCTWNLAPRIPSTSPRLPAPVFPIPKATWSLLMSNPAAQKSPARWVAIK